METITVRLDDALASLLAANLPSHTNKSAFIRDAIKEKLESENSSQKIALPSNSERTIIYLLLEVIKNLPSQSLMQQKDSENLQEVLLEGYAYDYETMRPVRGNIFPPEICEEVREILLMHRVLSNSVKDHRQKLDYTEDDIRFSGFDGNEETEHFSYANFVLGSLGQFKESACDNGCENTHWPILGAYRAMLTEWGKCKDKLHPTPTELERIIKAKNNHL